MKLTENQRRHIGETVTIRWGTSRGADTYGYTTCSLRNQRGERIAACNGGGYDMRGTVLGDWVARTFSKELYNLKPSEMPEHTHWEGERARICAGKCAEEWNTALENAIVEGLSKKNYPKMDKLPGDCWECPKCKGETHQSNDGTRVNEGRYFYGLSFHNPKFDPGAVIVTKSDGLLTDKGDEGKTIAQLEAEGKSLGLERYQAFYRASSKIPTQHHVIPLIDGACGQSSVMDILHAIGLDLKQVVDNKKLDVYVIEQYKKGG